MSFLLIPIAPLSRAKSRLGDCYTRDMLKELTIAMFKDLSNTLRNVNCFDEKIIYCNSPEILDLAEESGFIGIKEELKTPSRSFDEIIDKFNNIAVKKYDAQRTVICFVDLVLITAQNFYEIDSLLDENNIVICPVTKSAGISILGRNPPNIISSFFSDPKTPSLVALTKAAKKLGLQKVAIYDSFRAGFDVDIKQDLLLAYEYLKIFNLTNTETFKFLKNNLKLTLHKITPNNNRQFKIVEK